MMKCVLPHHTHSLWNGIWILFPMKSAREKLFLIKRDFTQEKHTGIVISTTKLDFAGSTCPGWQVSPNANQRDFPCICGHQLQWCLQYYFEEKWMKYIIHSFKFLHSLFHISESSTTTTGLSKDYLSVQYKQWISYHISQVVVRSSIIIN